MVQGSDLIVPKKIGGPPGVDVAGSLAEARAFSPDVEVSRPSAKTGLFRRRRDKTAHRTLAAGNVTSSEAPQP
jgi:hypothetical protein